MVACGSSGTILADQLLSLSAATEQELRVLLAAKGIADSYIGYAGETVDIPLANRVDILACMGTELLDGSDKSFSRNVHQALSEHEDTHWQSLLPPVQVVWRAVDADSAPLKIKLRLPEGQTTQIFGWQLITEEGLCFKGLCHVGELPVIANHTRSSATVGQELYSERELVLTDPAIGCLPQGYHQFSICPQTSLTGEPLSSDHSAVMRLIVAPSTCFQTESVIQKRRSWGISVQLYSLKSEHNWGIGDFGDLQRLIQLLAPQGVDYLILNPLHAGNAADPGQCSPYSPSDRRRLNPLYVDVSKEPDFVACVQSYPELDAHIKQQLLTLRHQTLVDYEAVSQLKYAVFARMYQVFRDVDGTDCSPRYQAFMRFVDAHDPALGQFTRWQAARPPAVAAHHGNDPDFYAYLQWLAETQLADCQSLAISQGMQTGLVRDLAVGSDRAGAEVSANPAVFCQSASVGAPPDPLAPQGQNWGLPPLHPIILQQQAYQHFIDLLRSNMGNCGALRIDHVMSLMRLWWCREHGDSAHGAYVFYPVADLFAILCLESQRQRCQVIGEDLGVVPPQVRQMLQQTGVLSNILFYFEKYDGIHMRRPEHFAAQALCMVANHDVPTLAAWWDGDDLRLRRQLGLITSTLQLQESLHQREQERLQVCSWLEAQWLLPADRFGAGAHQSMDESLAAAIVRCCARSQSQWLSVQLEDLLLEKAPINIPGTSAEYPNWRRRLSAQLWNVLSAPSQPALFAAINAER